MRPAYIYPRPATLPDSHARVLDTVIARYFQQRELCERMSDKAPREPREKKWICGMELLRKFRGKEKGAICRFRSNSIRNGPESLKAHVDTHSLTAKKVGPLNLRIP